MAQSLSRFFRGKRVVVTGHTGFKGSWLALWLHRMGAEVLGIALPPTSALGHFNACGLASAVRSEFLDIRQHDPLRVSLERFRPDIVFHLAAQAIVGRSYEDPAATFDVNLMGSVNVLEAVRGIGAVRSLVMVTSDKCYENIEQPWGYREADRLGGEDPYSASKACAEIAVRSYAASFFAKGGTTHVASARAGNVVGGGDWSAFRVVPDCVRSLRENRVVQIRNPRATRPWQFVLDPLAGYLMLAARLWEDGPAVTGAWNFGPAVDNTNDVERAAREIIRGWGDGSLEVVPNALFHESMLLQLDCSKARRHLGWRPTLDFEATMAFTTAWYRRQFDSADGQMRDFTLGQIEQFEALLDRAPAS